MTFEEKPSPFADMCEHAGVNKACRSCRETYNEVARISLSRLAQWHTDRARRYPLGDPTRDISSAESALAYRDHNFPDVS